jgi:hypothetical protein
MAAAGYDWPLPLAMTGHFGGFERGLPAKRWRRSAGRLGPCSKSSISMASVEGQIKWHR